MYLHRFKSSDIILSLQCGMKASMWTVRGNQPLEETQNKAQTSLRSQKEGSGL